MENEEARIEIAEECEFYDEVVEIAKRVLKGGGKLNESMRKSMKNAFQTKIRKLRNALNIIKDIENRKSQEQSQSFRFEASRIYRLKIEGELQKTCEEALVVSQELLDRANKSDDWESMVFYMKMQIDVYYSILQYKRFENSNADELIVKNYEEAMVIVENKMRATDHVRLNLALSYGIYLFEVKNQISKANRILQKVFDKAVTELDDISQLDYKQSVQSLEQIRGYLNLFANYPENADIIASG